MPYAWKQGIGQNTMMEHSSYTSSDDQSFKTVFKIKWEDFKVDWCSNFLQPVLLERLTNTRFIATQETHWFATQPQKNWLLYCSTSNHNIHPLQTVILHSLVVNLPPPPPKTMEMLTIPLP